MKHVISVLVDNKPGVLTRVSGLFSRRAYNIDSLAVGPSENKKHSRITMVVHGEDGELEQIIKQLHKLPDVSKVIDLTSLPHVDRELVLFRVSANNRTRHEIMSMVNAFRARVVDMADNTMVIEVTGNTEKINAIEDLFGKFGISEIARTGKLVIARGKRRG